MDIVINRVPAIGDRLDVHDRSQGLRRIIAREIRAQSMAAAFLGRDNPFDNNLSLRGNEKFLSPSFGRRKSKGLPQSAADHRIFVNVEGHPRQGTHAGSRVVADPGDSWKAFAS